MTPPLACTVRDCGLLLEARGRTYVCARRHAYDVARSGYINVLQPQDRRSRMAGDSVEAIEARARLLRAGVGSTLVQRVVELAAGLLIAGGVIADLGSGSGEVLAGVHDRVDITAIGIDLSTAAADHAARRFPSITWVVANADRRLPLLDHSVDVLVSVHGRRNPPDCARVLAPGAHLLVAIPAPDDLIELRTAVQGRGIQRDRRADVVADHAGEFDIVEQAEIREHRPVTGGQLRDLLHGTYRGARRATAGAVGALGEMEITLASQLLHFRRRA